MTTYGRTITLKLPFVESVQRVRDELKSEGFGVLTEIDVTATMRDKLGQTMEDYVILGACNPPLAHKALSLDRSVGLLLPCNVVVRAGEAETIVDVLDPQVMITLSGDERLMEVADEVSARLDRVLSRLQA